MTTDQQNKRKTPKVFGVFLAVICVCMGFLFSHLSDSKPLQHLLHDLIATKNVISDEITKDDSALNDELKSFIKDEIKKNDSEINKTLQRFFVEELAEDSSDIHKKLDSFFNEQTKNKFFLNKFKELSSRHSTKTFHGHFVFNKKTLLPTKECIGKIKGSKEKEISVLNDECWSRNINSTLEIPILFNKNDNLEFFIKISKINTENNETNEIVKLSNIPLVFELDNIELKNLEAEKINKLYSYFTAKIHKTDGDIRGGNVGISSFQVTLKELKDESEVELYVSILVTPSNQAEVEK